MKLAICLASLSLASCAAVQTKIPAQDSSAARANRISLYLGQRDLDEGDWSPVDEQATFGVEFAQEKPGSMVGWEVGLMGSSDDDTVAGFDVTGSTSELYGGVRKSFGEGVVRPYVGGGLAFINGKVDVSGVGDDDDSSAAGYAHGGIDLAVSEVVHLGLDLRLLFGSDITLFGVNGDADYGQLALVLGFAF